VRKEDRAGDTIYTTSDARQTHKVQRESKGGEHVPSLCFLFGHCVFFGRR